MVPLYPESHAQSLAASDPDELLELEGQLVQDVDVLVADLNWPHPQLVQLPPTLFWPGPHTASPRGTSRSAGTRHAAA